MTSQGLICNLGFDFHTWSTAFISQFNQHRSSNRSAEIRLTSVQLLKPCPGYTCESWAFNDRRHWRKSIQRQQRNAVFLDVGEFSARNTINPHSLSEPNEGECAFQVWCFRYKGQQKLMLHDVTYSEAQTHGMLFNLVLQHLFTTEWHSITNKNDDGLWIISDTSKTKPFVHWNYSQIDLRTLCETLAIPLSPYAFTELMFACLNVFPRHSPPKVVIITLTDSASNSSI